MDPITHFLLATAAAGAVAASDDQPRDEIVVTGVRSEGREDYGVEEQRTAFRLPLSQKETPQSVSVVTRAQIEDFQLNDVNQLLTTVPGVSVLAAETDRVYYSARGFDIQTFQIDGVGLPFAFGIQTGSIDTAIYDRIEVVRGAPGLLSPTGNPSALVNFVRKRPYRDFDAGAAAQYGSFDHLRFDADVSVPITSDGSVRARGVGAYLDTDSHLDRYKLKRWTGYGIVEADLGEDTVVSVGYAHQDHQSSGAQWGAVPLTYTDGTRVEFDRSDSTGPEWAGWGVIDRQIFGDITHDIDDNWFVRATVMRRAASEADELFYVYGNPDRETGLGIFSYPGKFSGETRNLTFDAHIGGKVTVGGREHDVMLGAVRGDQEYVQSSAYDYSVVGLSVPLSELFDGTFPRPDFPELEESLTIDSVRESIYGLVRLNPADAFKIMVGGSYSHASSEGVSYGAPQDFDESKFLPFIGATLELTPSISAYASYATIFNPQTEFDADNQLLDPVTGDNIEAGLKGEWMGGRLFASAAVFRANQKNTAEAAGFDADLGRSIYAGVDAKSEGVEFEIAGSPVEGLQLTGGFSAMRVRGEDGEPARTFVPRRTARFNAVWSPQALAALKLGASLQYQSDFYFEPGSVSVTTGDPIRIEQGGYALLDLMARYDVSDNIGLSVNVRNVTNARYLSSLTYEQSYYGAPRSIIGTISVGF
ncbi:TonB-dependent siderophore receptor [Alteraurantiacibacter aquimixticola]|uniref:TonB-dependent siderophore receptor n=1 Tax=Alteraurantiacibacter aquimixticola TaxID=2489173 RepID=A0A4T3F355_9SPHN|nr:TonB-dependent siderophore receptor [Alteraurantiacibacter aquimixticola]TIX50745.1 TonB-dependent siderophore receptor [Alteraurantiacibacter aquimixticola]